MLGWMPWNGRCSMLALNWLHYDGSIVREVVLLAIGTITVVTCLLLHFVRCNNRIGGSQCGVNVSVG